MLIWDGNRCRRHLDNEHSHTHFFTLTISTFINWTIENGVAKWNVVLTNSEIGTSIVPGSKSEKSDQNANINFVQRLFVCLFINIGLFERKYIRSTVCLLFINTRNSFSTQKQPTKYSKCQEHLYQCVFLSRLQNTNNVKLALCNRI